MKQPWTPEFFKGNGRTDRLAAIEVYPPKKDESWRPSQSPPRIPPVTSVPAPAPVPAGGRPVSNWSTGTVVPGEFRTNPSNEVPRSEPVLPNDWGRVGRRLGLGLAACGVLTALGFATFSGSTNDQATSQVKHPTPPPAQPVRYKALTDVGQAFADWMDTPRQTAPPASAAPPVRAATAPSPAPAIRPVSRTVEPVRPVSTSQPEYRFQQAALDLNVRFGADEPADDPPARNRVRESRPIKVPEGRSTRKPSGMRLSCPNVPLLPDP